MTTTTKLPTNDNKDKYIFLLPHNHCNDESQLIFESSSSSTIPLCKRRRRYSKENTTRHVKMVTTTNFRRFQAVTLLLQIHVVLVLVLVLALQLCCAHIQLIDAFCFVGYPTRKCSYIQYNNRHNMFTPIRNNDNNNEDENPIDNTSTSSMSTTTTTTNETNDSSRKQSLEVLKQQQQQQLMEQQKQLEQPIPPMTDPFQATGQNELFKTLAGGPALIFEMARKLVEDSDYNKRTTTSSSTIKYTTTPSSSETRQQQSQQRRWYPHSGISDVNPSFRTQSPAMNNQGFRNSIWRNVRKRNKPSLWKLALRTYDRMAIVEGDPNFPQIQRSNIHHEGAMQACAKLGLWQRALEIYHYVYQQEMGEIEGNNGNGNGNINRQQQQPQLEEQEQLTQTQKKSQKKPSKNKIQSTLGGGRNGGKLSTKNSKTNERTKKGSVYVTDDMVLSLVRATVRASRLRSRQKKKSHDPPLSPEQEEREAALRRIPLDTALEILSTLPEDHNIPLVAYYFNPLAGRFWGLLLSACIILYFALRCSPFLLLFLLNINTLT
jgi:hypothetical protein